MSDMSARKLTRQDLRDAAEKFKNWGRWGPDGRNRHAQLHAPRRHRRRGATGEEGQGHLARAQFRPARSPGRQEQVPGHGTHQPAARDAAHRNRRLLRRARPARHPCRRRHGGDAASMRHAVGRPGPHLLRELMWNGYDCREVTSAGAQKCGIEKTKNKMVGRGVFLDVPRVMGKEAAGRRLRHHRRRPRAHGAGAGREGEARRLRHRAHRADGDQTRRGQLGRLSRRATRRDFPSTHWNGYTGTKSPPSPPTPGATRCGRTNRSRASTSPGTGSPYPSWA